MVSIKNSYALLGFGLLMAGALLAVLANFVLVSVPLTALGISALIIGGVCFSLSRGDSKFSSEASSILLESGVSNVAAIVEELGLKSKAIYLPSSKTSGKPMALIALHSNPSVPKIEKALPKRLIVKFGENAEDMGILLTTPGSGVGGMVSVKVDATSGDIESALSSVLVGSLELVDSIRVSSSLASAPSFIDTIRVTGENERMVVELVNSRVESKNMEAYEWIGSPLASMVASIVAEVCDKQVIITRENKEKGKLIVELKLVG